MRLAEHFASNPFARSLAARTVVGRLVARRRARALFALATGFIGSQVLLAAIELRLPELLRAGDRELVGIAAALRLPPDRARALLDATGALGLTRRTLRGRYALGPLGAVLIGEPGLRAMIEHHRLLYADLADPAAMFRGAGAAPTRLRRFWDYGLNDTVETTNGSAAAYSALMALTIRPLVDAVVAAHELRAHRVILDVGGGEGAFLLACADHAPRAELVLFDRAPVVRRATARFRSAGLVGRTRVVAGDLRRDPLPEGADLVTLNRVLHDHDDRDATDLLRRIRAACRRGTVLLVAEPMAGADPSVDAYFATYLAAMGQGRFRTARELCRLLDATGWRDAAERSTPMPILARVVVAIA